MKRVVLLAVVLLAVPLFGRGGHGHVPHHCGKERWAIKTLADAASPSLTTTPRIATVAELITLAAPDAHQLRAATARRFPDETTIYAVVVYVQGFKLESDSDYHVVISDSADASAPTMIAEIPDPVCASSTIRSTLATARKSFDSLIGKPTARFTRLPQPHLVVMTGVGFFDFLHGQTGVAPNGFELHPVLTVDEMHKF